MKRRFLLKRAVLISLFSALISVSAFISIPLAPVPITLQSFAVFLSLFVLGPIGGSISVLLYIAIGAVGFPVFSGFSGGIGRLLDVGVGFIFGFLILAAVYGIISGIFCVGRVAKIISAIIAHLALYLSGVLWYVIAFDGELFAALYTFVLPFVLFDAVKLILAFFVAERLVKIIPSLR